MNFENQNLDFLDDIVNAFATFISKSYVVSKTPVVESVEAFDHGISKMTLAIIPMLII